MNLGKPHQIVLPVITGMLTLFSAALIQASVTIDFTAQIGQRKIVGGDGDPIADYKGEVRIGVFPGDFDIALHGNDLDRLREAWSQLGSTPVRGILGEGSRFSARTVVAHPEFTGRKLYLWIVRTDGVGPVAQDFANVLEHGIFSSTASHWKVPDGAALQPENSTMINSSQVDESFGGGVVTSENLQLSPVAPAVNDLPHATPQSVTTDLDTPVLITLEGSDADDGDVLGYSVTLAPAHGTTGIVTGNQVTYTPAAGYTGEDSFDYTVDDGNGGTDTASITITINDPSGAPTIHVAGIDMVAIQAGKNWKSAATVTIVDQDNQPVIGASVTGDWTFDGGSIGSVSGLTDATGTVLLSSAVVKKVSSGTFTFTVTGVTVDGAAYDAETNTITTESIGF